MKIKTLKKKQLIAELKHAILAIVKAEKFKSTPLDLLENPTKESIINAIMSSERIYFKKNVNLRFISGYDERFIRENRFKENWANIHPDPNATGYFVQLYFAASHISNFILVSVDRGRALLPLPKSSTNLEVSPLDYKVAQIHDRLNSLNEYMTRSKLQISGNFTK